MDKQLFVDDENLMRVTNEKDPVVHALDIENFQHFGVWTHSLM